jgi:uncharacterized glyoxalase superfamily protein PhnB
VDFKPDGYSSVSPYLLVDGADDTIAFIKQVFQGKELRRFADATGHLRHAEVKIDDTVLMVADCSDEHPAIASQIHVYVRDVEETFRRAVEAGAVPVKEPVKTDKSDVCGGVRQPNGITWWIATRMA